MWEVGEVERELGMGLQFPAPSEVPRESWVNLQWVAAPGSSLGREKEPEKESVLA